MVATPLHLPSHADIHEFNVLFTRSVKKKQKDWHDGFLKWHTFNFRAILYDDQRKQVANEFFPSRTIRSNSELEFASALVQIGDQTETLQANLDQIYRTNNRSHDVLLCPTTNNIDARTPAVQRTPVTPGVTKAIQRRIYPDTNTEMSRRVILHNMSTTLESRLQAKTQDTPIRSQSRRSIGISHPKSAVPRQLRYPCLSSQGSSNALQPDAPGPGWFARQDQLAVQPSSVGSRETLRPPRTLTTTTSRSAVRSRDRASGKKPSISADTLRCRVHTVDNVPPPCERIEADRDTPVSSETQMPTMFSNRVKSCLDPTRPTIKRKPRMLLSAGRLSVDAPDSSVTDVVVPRRIATQSTMSAKISQAGDEGLQMVTKRSTSFKRIAAERSSTTGIQKTDSMEDCKTTEVLPFLSSESQTVASLPTRTSPEESRIGAMSEIMRASPDPGSEAFIGLAADVAEESRIESVREVNKASLDLISEAFINSSTNVADDDTLLVRRQGSTLPIPVKQVPSLDEDGFSNGPIRSTRITQPSSSVQRTSIPPRKPRPTDVLLEQLHAPEPDSLLQSQDQERPRTERRPTRCVRPPRSPLFVPDGSQKSNDTDEDQHEAGLNTQVNRVVARTIAKHSSIGRIAPGACSKVVPAKRQASHHMNPRNKVHMNFVTPSKIVQNIDQKAGSSAKENHSDGYEPPRRVQQKSSAQSACGDVCSLSKRDPLAEMLFPTTPSVIETREIDSLFAIDESALRGPASGSTTLVSARALDVPVLQDRTYPHLGSEPLSPGSVHQISASAIPEKTAELGLATQIHERAPDFMTAKSFTMGRILPLDQTMPSLGITERELHNLDLATQLSEPDF